MLHIGKKSSWTVFICFCIGYISSSSYIYHSRNGFAHGGFSQPMNPRLSAKTFHKCLISDSSTPNPDFDKKNKLGCKAYMTFFARGAVQVNTPNATVMDLCKLKLPFFAKDTAQVNTPNATVSLRSGICRLRCCCPYIDL